MRKIYQILFLVLFVRNINFAQEIPVNKYDTSKKYKSFKEELDNEKHNMFGIGYNKTNFLNPIYGKEIKEGNFEYVFGATVFYRKQFAKQFIYDITGFYNLIKAPAYNVSNYGGEGSIGLILIPFSLKMTSVLQPFASVGYQLSSLQIESSDNEALVKDLKEKTANTSAFFWKAGMMIHISKTIFINAEYKQSFASPNERDFNSWNAGIGFRI